MIDNINIEIGKMIKVLRKSKCITQKELADKLNISTQQIHKYEHGIDNISVNLLSKISTFFDCNMSIFFPNNFKMNNNKSLLMVSEKKEKFNYQMDKNKDNETMEILKIFYSLKVNDRKKVLEYLKENYVNKK